MFPQGLFYILSRKHGFAIDVYDGQTKEDAILIVWPQKFQDSDNQLWSFDNGRLTNKKSGLVIEVTSSVFKKHEFLVQKKSKPNKQSQEWVYDNGFICTKENPNRVLDIKGDKDEGGAPVIVYKRKDKDNLNQLWKFEPYQQFENALNIAATSVPLHKKEGFGQPRPGYAAEPGVPPELKQVPGNNKIAGFGNNVSPSSTTTGPGNSRIDPVLAQYGSFYGGSTTAPAPAQPGQAPSSNHQYPPPPGQTSNQYPPPPPAPNNDYLQSNQTPSPPAFPQPIPATSAYPPPPANNSNSGYPQQQPYPLPSSSPSGYHQPPSPSNYHQQAPPPPPASSGGYPPPPSGYPGQSQPGYPPASSPTMSPGNSNNFGYPPAHSQQQSSIQLPSGYPSSNYPSSNNASGYPAPGNSFYQQQQQPGMPTGYNDSNNNNSSYGYPQAGSPSLPGNRPLQPQQDQYGYPTYPQ